MQIFFLHILFMKHFMTYILLYISFSAAAKEITGNDNPMAVRHKRI